MDSASWKEPPSSGTAERLQAQENVGAVRNALLAASGIGGTVVGAQEALPYVAPYVSPEAILPTLAPMGASFGAGRVANSVLLSPAVYPSGDDRLVGFARER